MSNPDQCGIAAVRGAVTVPTNTADDVLDATRRLLEALIEANQLEPARIVSAIFTATPDLDADFPAHAARRLGWLDVPLLGAREMAVPGAMPRVIRVLLTVWGVAPGTRLEPVYLDGAAELRPDLTAARRSGAAGSRSGGVPGGAAAAADRARSEALPRDAPLEKMRRVAIVGLGQIGGSIGLALGGRRGWQRVGWDRDPGVKEEAMGRGAIDEIAGSLIGACEGAELAVIATPVDAIPGVVHDVVQALPRGAALMDTGSARSGITPALEEANRSGIRAVGGHPIAGTEGRGIGAARADLFQSMPFALLPAGGGVPEIVSALVRDVGAQPVEIGPEAHDRALARTSHLPYLLACALREIGEDAARHMLSGPGFRDMTRLAASDPRTALAYCRANAGEIADAWRELKHAVDEQLRERLAM